MSFLPGRQSVVAENFSGQASWVWFAMATRANPVFQQILRGPSGLELFKGPFQNQLSEIAELSFFPGSKLLKLSSQSFPDPQAELCFPFTHCPAIDFRRTTPTTNACVVCR